MSVQGDQTNQNQWRLAEVRRRGIEAVNWGIPAVNYLLMEQAVSRALGCGSNQVVSWSRLLDWHNQTLTPNPDAVYLMPFLDTTSGPVVVEIPAAEGNRSIIGSVMDGWQVALEDVGRAGVDKGDGGKYLILPPDYQGEVPDGYIALPSQTFRAYALLRSSVTDTSDAEVAAAVEFGQRVKVYLLAQADDPPPTTFLDAAGVDVDATIGYDLGFFELLHAFVQREPWLHRDRVMIDFLRSIGIEKGHPFSPDAEVAQALTEAVAEAHSWLDARYESAFDEGFFPGTHWALPASPEMVKAAAAGYEEPDSYPIDSRGGVYSWGFSGVKHLGAGQFYLLTPLDSHGNRLDGARNYRLTVPANPPVDLYWSVTAYDRDTHALIPEVSRASRASTSAGLVTSDDGSVVLDIGPQQPDHGDANWLPTHPGRPFELLIRFYGPQPALFEKAWSLPDVEPTDD